RRALFCRSTDLLASSRHGTATPRVRTVIDGGAWRPALMIPRNSADGSLRNCLELRHRHAKNAGANQPDRDLDTIRLQWPVEFCPVMPFQRRVGRTASRSVEGTMST